jgi:transposase
MGTIHSARQDRQSRFLKIARYGLDNWVELREYTPIETIRYQLKNMNRQFNMYTKNKTAFKNNLIALLDQTYPGANTFLTVPPVTMEARSGWILPQPFAMSTVCAD